MKKEGSGSEVGGLKIKVLWYYNSFICGLKCYIQNIMVRLDQPWFLISRNVYFKTKEHCIVWYTRYIKGKNKLNNLNNFETNITKLSFHNYNDDRKNRCEG